MEKIIDGLLSDLERGKITRRQLVQSIAVVAASAGAATPTLGAAAPRKLVASSVNHISYGVADYGKARDFYSDFLSMKVIQDDGKQAILGFGTTMLVIRKTRQPDNKPYIDHIAYTIDNWDEAGVEAELRRRGHEPYIDNGQFFKSFHIKDPDGFDVQVTPANK